MRWVVRAVAALGVAVVGWCLATGWSAVVHGHPLYAALLLATLAGCVVAVVASLRPPRPRPTWVRILGIVLTILAVGWIALMAWLRPFAATEPALSAMVSDATVTVQESATQIVLTPTGDVRPAGILFQPGAKVDARAYAAVLRPLAEAGYPVVIPKQPLGIAFLSTGAFESAQAAHPEIAEWIVGGHSLGGTVAAIDAEAHDTDAVAPVTGLMLYASYPASDMSATLASAVISISGSEDALATPADIEASRADLPPNASFVVLDGAVHAFFGDYGPQPGDGTPTITHDEARALISEASLAFVATDRVS